MNVKEDIKMDLAEMIVIMEAYNNGSPVEVKYNGEKEWMDVRDPAWNWELANYRIRGKKTGQPLPIQLIKLQEFYTTRDGTLVKIILKNNPFFPIIGHTVGDEEEVTLHSWDQSGRHFWNDSLDLMYEY